jgi:16S rRNA (cytosine967-C5)-methyltransferase
MRLGGRLAAAIEILEGLEKRPQPSSVALNDWAKAHRFAGSGDRNAIGSLVHDALRNKALNAWRLGAEPGVPGTMRLAAWGALLFQWGMDLTELDALLAGDTHAPAPLDDASRTALRTRRPADAPPHVRVNIPEALLPRFQPAFGDDWERELAAFSQRPALDLRANTLKAARKTALEALSIFGAAPAHIAPDAMRIAPSDGEQRLPNVTAEPAFARGLYEVQDLGSQIAAALVLPEPGMEVLDFCAGAGGKTLAVAAAMGGKGRIHAYDVDRRRLSPMIERINRAGAANIELVERPAMLTPLIGVMDRVIADAPCSGTGTWRRRPDIKWRLSEGNLSTRLAEQAKVLDDSSRHVKPGGRLIYITCSILPDENDRQIEAFLARDTRFAAMDMDKLWRDAFKGEREGQARRAGPGLLLTPASTGTDGFFVCVMQRNT